MSYNLGTQNISPLELRAKVLKEPHQSHPWTSQMKAPSTIHIWFPNIDH